MYFWFLLVGLSGIVIKIAPISSNLSRYFLLTNTPYFNGWISRMAPKIGTAVCGTSCTAVSCFYALRCVASCFQPSLRDTSLLFYRRIPSYRVNREFLFGHLTTKDSQGSSHLLLYCTIQSFPIDNPCLGYYDLCWLLATSCTPSWYIEYIIFTMRPQDLLG